MNKIMITRIFIALSMMITCIFYAFILIPNSILDKQSNFIGLGLGIIITIVLCLELQKLYKKVQ